MGTRVTVLIVAATAVCALGTGLYMQQTADLQRATAEAKSSEPAALPAEPETGKLVFQDVAFTSARPLERSPQSSADDVRAEMSSCDGDMLLSARPDALLQVDLSAPCRAGERFTLHHGGVMITHALDAEGKFSGVVPALASHAVVIADFASGRDLDAVVTVDDLDTVERVVLQWQGESGLEVHALEFGATYGEPGHVWKGSEASFAAGQVLSLGDSDQIAAQRVEVYTLPKDAGTGAVSVSIEAEITALNCDRSVDAQLMEYRGDRLQTRDLTLNIPECSAVGDFLVLNNLVESLKIAAN